MLVTGLTGFDNQRSGHENAFGSFFNSNMPRQDALNYGLDDIFDDRVAGGLMTPILPEEDPSLIQAARNIYETYYTVHPEVTELPLGVAIDRISYRGKLIFKQKPALLPKECFIPFSSIDAR
jgi:hypothetical protein